MVVDTRGKLCPAPIILTKKALNNAPQGEVIEVWVDNDTSCNNLTAFLAELDIKVVSTKRNSYTVISFIKGSTLQPSIAETEIVCEVPSQKSVSGKYIIVFKSERMGEGDNALGELLVKAYLNTLCESDTIPETIILYNSGVKLAHCEKDSATILSQLEARGVKIVSCGTCADYYEIKEYIKVGIIGNMYKIAELLATASHIIYP